MSKISGIGENKLRELMDCEELEYIQNGNRRLIADAVIWDWYERAKRNTKRQSPGQIASIATQGKQTVASYLNCWVGGYARVNLRPSTYDGYKKTIANYINPYVGGVALNQLTPTRLISWRSEKGRPGTGKGTRIEKRRGKEKE